MGDDILPPGKLPGELLKTLIQRYVFPSQDVIIGPGIGRDAAAIDLGDRILIVKTDPITFATDDIGRYLVNVNANDIACMGGEPRWLLVTALLPERSTTPALVESLFRSVSQAAREIGVALVGGHTEITLGIDRPILVGQMIGESSRDDLVDPSSAQPGDVILLCSGIAIEGTAILARDPTVSDRLNALTPEMIAPAVNLLVSPGISVLPAARALRQAGVVPRALHDPTEGGIATALAELGDATGLGVTVDADTISILPETTAICDALGLDPLGLIASGALLAVVSRNDAERAIGALHRDSISAAEIGYLTDRPLDRWMLRAGTRFNLPTFAVDEIARHYAQAR